MEVNDLVLQPGKPETAKSKFFNSAEEAKVFVQSLIDTKSYRVDVGIGQINNEAHIQPKGWSLEEVLNPETALEKVAHALKERGWAHYHSSNPFFAERWRRKAVAALDQALLSKSRTIQLIQSIPQKQRNPLLVYGTQTEVIKGCF